VRASGPAWPGRAGSASDGICHIVAHAIEICGRAIPAGARAALNHGIATGARIREPRQSTIARPLHGPAETAQAYDPASFGLGPLKGLFSRETHDLPTIRHIPVGVERTIPGASRIPA
jgi:hypothetical protein